MSGGISRFTAEEIRLLHLYDNLIDLAPLRHADYESEKLVDELLFSKKKTAPLTAEARARGIEYAKKRYQEKRDEIAEYKRQWYKRNKERIAAQQRNYRENKMLEST